MAVLIGLGAGCALLLALVLSVGAHSLVRAFESVPIPLAFAVGWHVVTLVLLAEGWRCFVPGPPRPRFAQTLRFRWVAESINALLPVAQVGGDLMRARLLTFAGVPAHAALAALVADVAVGTGTQVLFVMVALVPLLWAGRAGTFALPAAVGITLLAVGSVALVLFVKRGARRLFQRLERWPVRWGPVRTFAGRLRSQSDQIEAALDRLFTLRRAIAWSCLAHLAAWLTQAVETWGVLRLAGAPVGLGTAFALEALSSAVRSAVFVVPGGLGVQEGTLVLLGRHLGVPPEAALTIGIVKRLREALLGAPGLLVGSVDERRARRRRRVPRTSGDTGLTRSPADAHLCVAGAAMADFIGSSMHKELLVSFFCESHDPYRPAELPWPTLELAARDRLASLPIWEEALRTESNTAMIVATKAETEPDPLLAEAIRLQAYEEARHADLIERLIRRYDIPVPAFTAARPLDPDWAFMRIGYGECFDSFFAFGLFALARDSGLFFPELVALFEPVMQEEGRHIIFHVNWMAYTQRQLPFATRPSYVFTRALAIWIQLLARLRTALRIKSKTPDNFTLNTHERFADISPRAFIELCLAENEARLSRYDRRLLRPSFVPAAAKAVLATLPRGRRRAA